MALPQGHAGSSLSREQAATLEVGHTAIEPAIAWLLVVVFLGVLAVAALYQTIGGHGDDGETTAATPWSHLTGLAVAVPERVSELRASTADPSAWSILVSANRVVLAGIQAFEDTLEEESRVGRLLRPPAQLGLVQWLGAGNERVYPGRGGWLFYRPDVEHVTGPGFLLPHQAARRMGAAPEWTEPPQADPRPAIARLNAQLRARGVTLVLMPTPVKPTVHPGRLSARHESRDSPLQNVSYETFVDEMRRLGVAVFDPAPMLVRDATGSASAQYLASDTHWRPEAVERTAARLATFLQSTVALPPAADPGYRIERRQVVNQGDTTAMLDLPPGQQRYPPESVVVGRVVGADGSPWRASRSGDILVLGDSFANIYSTASLGWGDSAGLVEHLSYALRRPIDRIVQNDQGAFATRARLARDMAAGSDRLAGKRVVVYQFATRELSSGDWRLIDLAPLAGPYRP